MFSSLLVKPDVHASPLNAFDLALKHLREKFPGDLTPESILKLQVYWQFINPFPSDFDSATDNQHVQFLHYVSNNKPAMLVELLSQNPKCTTANCSMALHVLIQRARVAFISGFLCQIKISGIKIAISNLDPLEPLERFSLMQAQQTAETPAGLAAPRGSRIGGRRSTRRTSLMRQDTIDDYKNVTNCLFALYVESYCASPRSEHNLDFWIRFGAAQTSALPKRHVGVTLLLHLLGRNTQLFCDIVASASAMGKESIFEGLSLEGLIQEHVNSYCTQEMLSQIASNAAFKVLMPNIVVERSLEVAAGIIFSARDLADNRAQNQHAVLAAKRFGSDYEFSHYVFELLMAAREHFSNDQLHVEDFAFFEHLCGVVDAVRKPYGLPEKAFKESSSSAQHQYEFRQLHPAAKLIAALLAQDKKTIFSMLSVNMTFYQAMQNSSLTYMSEWVADISKIELLIAFMQAHEHQGEKEIIALLTSEPHKTVFENISTSAMPEQVARLSFVLASSNRLQLFRYVHQELGLGSLCGASDYVANEQLYQRIFSDIWSASFFSFDLYRFFKDHPAFNLISKSHVSNMVVDALPKCQNIREIEGLLRLSPCCLVYEYYINTEVRSAFDNLNDVYMLSSPLAHRAKSLSLKGFLLKQDLLLIDLEHLQYFLSDFFLPQKQVPTSREVSGYLASLNSAYERVAQHNPVQAHNAIFHSDNAQAVYELFSYPQKRVDATLGWFSSEANRVSLDCLYYLIKEMMTKGGKNFREFRARMHYSRMSLLGRVVVALRNQYQLVFELSDSDVVREMGVTDIGRRNEHQLKKIISGYKRNSKFEELSYVIETLELLFSMNYFIADSESVLVINQFDAKHIIGRCISIAKSKYEHESRSRSISVDVKDDVSEAEKFCERYFYKKSSFSEKKLLELMRGEKFDSDYQHLLSGSCGAEFFIKEFSLFLITEKCFSAYQYMVSVKGMAPRDSRSISQEEMDCFGRAFESLMISENLPLEVYVFYSENAAFSGGKEVVSENLLRHGPEKYPLAYVYEFYLNKKFRAQAKSRYSSQYKTPLSEEEYGHASLENMLRVLPSIDCHSLSVLLERHIEHGIRTCVDGRDEHGFFEPFQKALQNAFERNVDSQKSVADESSLSLRDMFQVESARDLFHLLNSPVYVGAAEKILCVANKKLLEGYFQMKLQIISFDPVRKKDFVSKMMKFRGVFLKFVVSEITKKHRESVDLFRPDESLMLMHDLCKWREDPKRYLLEIIKDAVAHDDLAVLSYTQSLLSELLVMNFFSYDIGCKKANALEPYLKKCIATVEKKLNGISSEAERVAFVVGDNVPGAEPSRESDSGKPKSGFRKVLHLSGNNQKLRAQMRFFGRKTSQDEATASVSSSRRGSGEAIAKGAEVKSEVRLRGGTK